MEEEEVVSAVLGTRAYENYSAVTPDDVYDMSQEEYDKYRATLRIVELFRVSVQASKRDYVLQEAV